MKNTSHLVVKLAVIANEIQEKVVNSTFNGLF